MTTFEQRFLAKVGTAVGDGCMEWLGYVSTTGYGMIRDPNLGRPTQAHRVAYEYWVGSIPAGLYIDHLCRNGRCVRPDHLEVVTQQENVMRGDAAGPRSVCSNGHDLSEVYSFTRGSGAVHRVCRECKAERQRRYRRKLRAEATT